MTLIEHDPWLSDVFGWPVYRVGADEATEANDLTNHAKAQNRALYFGKVPTNRVDVVRTLARAGFVVVDVNVTYAMDAPYATQPPLVDVGECTAKTADAVLDIAGSCFRYTRFHLDPGVDMATAHRIKREWIRNYILKKRGDRLLVAHLEGKPAGFLAALVTSHGGMRTAVIDLVGVATTLQRRGIATSLVRYFIQHYGASCPSLAVGTQVANTPSIRMYEALGFRLARSEYVLHKHVPDN